MLSAHSAYKITTENSHIDSVENTLKLAFRQIKAAALNGEYYTMTPCLGTDATSVLQSLGYTIAEGHRDINGPGMWASGVFNVILWGAWQANKSQA